MLYTTTIQHVLRFQFSFPEQHISAQQLRQMKHPKPTQSWVNAIAHWLFIWVQTWMQHMQQKLLQQVPQQFMEALTKISTPSGPFVSSDPGWMFSVVAVKLPNPIPKGGSKIILCPCSFAPLWGWLFFYTFLPWFRRKEVRFYPFKRTM